MTISEGDNMKKKLINFSAIALSAMLLTSCSIGALPAYDQTETEAEAPTTTTTTTSEETTVPTYEDFDSQLTFISGKYADLYDTYMSDDTFYPNARCAVTDFNHNGRLEVIITTYTNSALSSCTAVYEISEDYTDLVKLNFSDASSVDFLDAGDFYDWRTDHADIEVYDCYLKDGMYYYLIDGYETLGWSDHFIVFYSYTFGKTIRRDLIVNASVHIPEGEYTIMTLLGNSSSNRVTEDEYFECVNSYWDGYEKQKSCEVKWFLFSDEAGFADNLKDSWKAFNPESEKSSDVNFDFRTYFRSFYGDEYEFEIQN